MINGRQAKLIVWTKLTTCMKPNCAVVRELNLELAPNLAIVGEAQLADRTQA